VCWVLGLLWSLGVRSLGLLCIATLFVSTAYTLLQGGRKCGIADFSSAMLQLLDWGIVLSSSRFLIQGILEENWWVLFTLHTRK
jgi:hypothetical protein